MTKYCSNWEPPLYKGPICTEFFFFFLDSVIFSNKRTITIYVLDNE
jgi:hypothetical protein